jgi:hypothetical protein
MVARWHMVVVPTSLGNPYHGYEQNGTENNIKIFTLVGGFNPAEKY